MNPGIIPIVSAIVCTVVYVWYMWKNRNNQQDNEEL
jgi:hypothetical protein